MEFVSTSLLLGREAAGGLSPTFEQLRQLPFVKITPEARLVEEPENVAVCNALADEGYRVVRVTKEAPKRNFVGRIEFPRRVILEMTSRCNLLCRMCPRNSLHRPLIDMDSAAYCRLLDEANAHGVEGVWTYHLGESLLHPDFRKIIRYAEGLDNIGSLWMSTNGHLMTDDSLDFIFDSRIDYINFSLHAVSADVYATVCQGGDFDLVMNNYGSLVRRKAGHLRERPFVHLQMIEQETTKGQTAAFIEMYRKEVEMVSVNMLEYSQMPNNEFGLRQRERGGRGRCKRVSRGDCFVCSNGAVTLCDVAYDCMEERVGILYLGNIHEQSIHDIWNGERRKTILDMEGEGKLEELPTCAQCTDYDI